MQTKSEKQQQAQELYLNTDKSSAEIADILDLNRKTVYLWIKNGLWDEMKKTAQQAPGIILRDIYSHIATINQKVRDRDDRCPTPQEVVSLSKLVNITKVIDAAHVGSHLQSFTELLRFIKIREKDHDFTVKVTQYADEYVKGSLFDKDRVHIEKDWATVNHVNENLDIHDSEPPIPEIPKSRHVQSGGQVPGDDDVTSGTPNVTFGGNLGKDGVMVFQAANAPEPAPIHTQEEINNAPLPQNSLTEKISEFGVSLSELKKEPEVSGSQVSVLNPAFLLNFLGFFNRANAPYLPEVPGIFIVSFIWRILSGTSFPPSCFVS